MIMKKNFLKSSPASRQRGQGMSEYIIVVALIAVASIGVFAAFGTTIKQQVTAMAREISGQDGGESVTSAQEAADTAGDRASDATTMKSYTTKN